MVQKTTFTSPSDFANFVQSLRFRSQQMSGSEQGTAAANNTVASAVIGEKGVIKSFRARVIDGGTVAGTRNVASMVLRRKGEATETTILTLANTAGASSFLSDAPTGACAEVNPGDLLVLKRTVINGATRIHMDADVDKNFA